MASPVLPQTLAAPASGGFGRPSGPKDSADLDALVDFLSLVMDNLYSGIIVCDCNCRILFMNKVYGELLGTDPALAAGKPIEEFFTHSRLPQVVASGQVELGQRCVLKSAIRLLVNRIPLKRDGEVIGIILQTIFRDYKNFTNLLNRLDLLEKEVSYYKKGLNHLLSAIYNFDSLVGHSAAIDHLKQLCLKYAQTHAPVLVTGATGTGKELLAHAIHQASPRAEGPFVCVNCAALPRDLLEAELFGYESGAFTGAHRKGKVGKIQLADKGTLFLDEIGELPFNAQAKLLRVLETKRLERLGGLESLPVDFRLIAATNRDLKAMMDRGDFRDDLFYRLNTMSVTIPALSERIEDLPLLIGHFLATLGRGEVRFSPEALEILSHYPWPGNIRELKNVIERALSLADGNRIHPEHLPPELVSACTPVGTPATGEGLAAQMARCEGEIVQRALCQAEGNMSRAARALGISRTTLYEKCRRHGIDAPRRHDPADSSAK